MREAIIPPSNRLEKRSQPYMFREEKDTLDLLKSKLEELRGYL
jgi:hypothetical protein